MKQFKRNPGSRSPITLTGENITEAIAANSRRFGRYFDFGNAAGFKILSVEEIGWPEGVRVPEGKVKIRVTHKGLPCPPDKDPQPQTMEIIFQVEELQQPA